MAAATSQDVAVAIGRPISSSDELAQVDYWLDSAELLISARLGDVTLLDQSVLRYVETEAVAVRMQNPNGYQSESIDDYTYRYGSTSNRIEILDIWWHMLDPDTGSGAFSVRPSFDPDTERWPGNNDLDRFSPYNPGWGWGPV